MEANVPQPLQILRIRSVQSMVGLSRSTIYAMIADGSFPKPIKLGKRAVGWMESEVLHWLEERRSVSFHE